MADVITPSSATVTQGKTATFSLKVTWTLEPAGNGSIDDQGLYTAPAAIVANTDVDVVAKDATGCEIGRAAIRLTAAKTKPRTIAAEPITPNSVELSAGEQQPFSLPVTWALDPITAPGSLDARIGVYAAPCDLTITKSFCVVAKDSLGNLLGRANVTAAPPPPPTKSLTLVPDGVSLGANEQAVFRVDPSSQPVTWQPAGVGTLDARTGVYTAPAEIAQARAVVITAITADETLYGTAIVHLSDAAYWAKRLAWFWMVVCIALGLLVICVWPQTATREELGVVVSPPVVTLNVTKDKTSAFTAAVLGVGGDTQKAVRWSRAGAGPGQVEADTGTYTVQDETEGDVFVTATSTLDTTRSNSAHIFLTNTVSLAVMPATQTLAASKSAQFQAVLQPAPAASAEGQPAPAVAVEWSLSPERGTLVQDRSDQSRVTYVAPASIERTEAITITTKSGQAVAAASIILSGPPPSATTPNLIAFAIVMGSVGAALHAVVSLTAYIGSSKFVSTWFWWYIFRPFVGGALALIFYFLIAIGKAGGAPLEPAWVALLCGMTGMFADKATGKLSDVFDALIGPKTDPRANKLTNGAGATTSPQPQAPDVTSIEVPPAGIKVGDTPVIKVTGTNFRDGVKVLVKSVEHTPSNVSATSLDVQLTAADTAAAGDIEVIVTNSDATKSAAKTFQVK